MKEKERKKEKTAQMQHKPINYFILNYRAKHAS